MFCTIVSCQDADIEVEGFDVAFLDFSYPKTLHPNPEVLTY